MKQEELNKILEDHKLWIESGREKGKQAYLHGANLQGANLKIANLSYAILNCANLSDANLAFANLQRAHLEGANLKNANLTGANLLNANLEVADLTGAKFTIEIRDALFLDCCRITKDQLPWFALHSKFSKFYPTLKVIE